jgi:hypothetical protein
MVVGDNVAVFAVNKAAAAAQGRDDDINGGRIGQFVNFNQRFLQRFIGR